MKLLLRQKGGNFRSIEAIWETEMRNARDWIKGNAPRDCGRENICRAANEITQFREILAAGRGGCAMIVIRACKTIVFDFRSKNLYIAFSRLLSFSTSRISARRPRVAATHT